MKYLYLILFVSIISCKNDKKTTPDILDNKTPLISSDTIPPDSLLILDKALTLELKQKNLIEKKDDRIDLQQLILQKKFYKETDSYTIDFTYPLLNNDLNEKYGNFNEFINKTYIDVLGTETDILECKELLCDSLKTNNLREKRYINYKIYNVNEQLVSVLFYKENFYSKSLHPTYTFDCMNFDLDKGVFMNYEDFFIEGTEDEFTEILNEAITNQIKKGDMYYDCWEISKDDFFKYKNNFVINDDVVEFYFDDCVMCPSYTGSYSIKIPIVNLVSVVRKYNTNPFSI